MIGNLVSSLAGRDKDKVYIIINEESEYVYLSDGSLRPINKLKKKNKKHIQIIKKGFDQNLAVKLTAGEMVYNEEIKRMIQLYEKQRSNQI